MRSIHCGHVSVPTIAAGLKQVQQSEQEQEHLSRELDQNAVDEHNVNA